MLANLGLYRHESENITVIQIRNLTVFFYLPWPENDLDRIEAAFIRNLKPRYNIGRNGKLNFPGWMLPAMNFEATVRLINLSATSKGE